MIRIPLFKLGIYKLRGIVVTDGAERILSEEEIFEFNKTHATARFLSDYYNGSVLSRYARVYEKGKLIRQFGYAIFKKDKDTGYRLFPEYEHFDSETHWRGYKRVNGMIYAYHSVYSWNPNERTAIGVASDLLAATGANSWTEITDYIPNTGVKK